MLLMLFLLLLFLSCFIPQTYLQSLVKIGSGTAEISMTLSLRWVSGWWFKVIFVSTPTFELSCGWVGVVTICIQKPRLQASNKNILKPRVQKSVLLKIGLYVLGVGGVDYQEDTNHIIFRST